MKKNKSEEKHNYICDLVQKELERRGFNVISYYNYKGEYDGELDILAYKQNYKHAIIIEVKYSNGYKQRNHAKKQLQRAKKYCPLLKKWDNISTMYAYHYGNTYQLHKL